jgi:D-beta-D-heptose 7-phosphate kinase/D-beta-D-heptose 1-phosphate adenosyltransferase
MCIVRDMFLDCKPQNIVVFGDVMLDYIYNGSINKLANEAPIPVFLKETQRTSLGGCGNVLQNLSSLNCQNLYLFSMCGKDDDSKELETCLNDLKIEYYLAKMEKKTTSKHRFFCNNKLVFRYDNEEVYSLNYDEEKRIIDTFRRIIDNCKIDCILFSDYNKGFLTKTLCQSVIEIANLHNIFTCVDPKKDYTKYKNCSLIKPNRHEVEQLFGIHFSLDTLPEVHKQIKTFVNCKNTVITLGDQGISSEFENGEYFYWNSESKDVIDVTGAGDIVNSVLSYYYPSLDDKKLCVRLASYLATISVQHLGTYKLQQSDILLAEKKLHRNKILRREDLKKLSKPIVFTNGCFDILHEGHVSLLNYCKALGSQYDVVLGLNSDTSIKRLKGESRPIFPLASRLAVLSSLESIDWIVVFEEDTPESLLKELRPDILVKGGDYTAETVIGREYCKELKLFQFVHDISTTKIVSKLNCADNCKTVI